MSMFPGEVGTESRRQEHAPLNKSRVYPDFNLIRCGSTGRQNGVLTETSSKGAFIIHIHRTARQSGTQRLALDAELLAEECSCQATHKTACGSNVFPSDDAQGCMADRPATRRDERGFLGAGSCPHDSLPTGSRPASPAQHFCVQPRVAPCVACTFNASLMPRSNWSGRERAESGMSSST